VGKKKKAAEVSKLVAGPHRVFICDSCVAIASRIMSDSDGAAPPPISPSSFRSRIARWFGRELLNRGQTTCSFLWNKWSVPG